MKHENKKQNELRKQNKKSFDFYQDKVRGVCRDKVFSRRCIFLGFQDYFTENLFYLTPSVTPAASI